MTRKQRIHSAELRRLDHIAQSLDRIGDAMERLHEVVVSGNNNRIIDVGGDIKGDSRVSQDTNNSIGRDGINVNASNGVTIQRGNNDNIQGDGNRYARDNSESFNRNSDEAMTNLTATIKSHAE